MTYPRRHLQENETILTEQGTHLIRILPNLLAVALIFAGLGAGFDLWRSAPMWFGIALGVIFLCTLGYLFIKLLTFRSTQLVLTNQRLIYRSGIVRRAAHDLSLSSIVDLSTRQSILERLVGYGDLLVRTNARTEPLEFYDLKSPKQFMALIEGAKEALERSRLAAIIAESAPVDKKREHRRLATLHRKGVITQLEFDEHLRLLGLNQEVPPQDRDEDDR